MPHKRRRTDGLSTGRVPKPYLAKQLAQATAGSRVDSTGPASRMAPDSTAAAPEPDCNESCTCGCHESPHATELQVQRHLLEQEGLSFSSLVIRRMDNGLCLQGVVETSDDQPDFARLVREVAAVDNVISQLVVRPCPACRD